MKLQNFWKCIPLLLVYSVSLGQNVIIRSTVQNMLQSKTICAFELIDLNDFDTITCPIGYKISVINAVLFDTARNLTECLPMAQTDIYIKTVKNQIQDICNDYNCSIYKSFLITMLFNLGVVNNLSLDISWQCFIATSTYSIIDTPSVTYSFTYFFYIITLVLSTSCILIGAIFILRKFLILRRRRNNGFTQQARLNRGFVSASSTVQNNSDNTVWMTACPPPSYENIYDSSFSINRLPDYNSTIIKNKKQTKAQKENESNVISVQVSAEALEQPLNEETTQPTVINDLSLQSNINPDILDVAVIGADTNNRPQSNQEVTVKQEHLNELKN